MSSSSTLSLDHLPPSQQLCYVHCTVCDTVLAVSVPCTSLFQTVTVRCGHCTNLLPVNMRGLLVPSANQFHLAHSFFTPSHNLLEEISNTTPNLLLNQANNTSEITLPTHGVADELPRPPVINRREISNVDSHSINLKESTEFSMDEIQRIKAENPDITHREAFSAAAKNWAHFPHIHFGLKPDQPAKRANVHQQDGEEKSELRRSCW
ncbi:hypothetical protein V6N13_076977 [Hibiscus sabdariffa]|uniref:Uncharacterized protein n=1 Tax=Hibiscus sabdariffa TaxID=183260 RepID=A0ABR2CMH3_9ROSI